MTRRFCDLCDKPLQPEDDKPFIKQLPLGVGASNAMIVVSLAVTNEHLHIITDICNSCKLKVVNEGQQYTAPSQIRVATLQPEQMSKTSTIPIFRPSMVPSMPAKIQP